MRLWITAMSLVLFGCGEPSGEHREAGGTGFDDAIHDTLDEARAVEGVLEASKDRLDDTLEDLDGAATD